MADAAILKNAKMAISQQWFDWPAPNLARWCKLSPNYNGKLRFSTLKSQDGRQLLSWKLKNGHISATKFGQSMHIGPSKGMGS